MRPVPKLILTLTLLTAAAVPSGTFRALAAAVTPADDGKTVTYRGRVVDAQNGEPLPGAVVRLSGSNRYGAVTDSDGNFTLALPAGRKPVVEASFLSYKTTEFTIDKNGSILALEPDNTFLDEVQVVAYGQQRRVTVTGAVSSISSDDILKSPSGSVANALAGAITGVSSVN